MKSLNTHADYTVKGHLMNGKEGDILIGNRAFEFYNERNVKDCIQIPWEGIDRVRVVFINGMVVRIYIDHNGLALVLSSKDNISLLKWMRRYLKRERFIQEKTFIQKLTGKA